MFIMKLVKYRNIWVFFFFNTIFDRTTKNKLRILFIKNFLSKAYNRDRPSIIIFNTEYSYGTSQKWIYGIFLLCNNIGYIWLHSNTPESSCFSNNIGRLLIIMSSIQYVLCYTELLAAKATKLPVSKCVD